MSTAAVDSSIGASPDETIRKTVKALRSANDTDARVLAARLGISRNSLYNRLNGTAPFLAAEIAGLSAFFGVPVADFYEGIVRVGATRATNIDTAWYSSPSRRTGPRLTLVTDPDPGYPAMVDSYGSSCHELLHADDALVAHSAEAVNDAHAA